MKDKIVIIGGGGHAKVLANVIKKNLQYSIVGYVDIENKGEPLGIKYLGSDDVLGNLFLNGIHYSAIGLGQIKIDKKRLEMVSSLKDIGYQFPNIISNNSIINENVQIGEGVQVFDGVVINCDTQIGSFSIINTNATIEHDCRIGNFCHIAPGATLSGGVQLDDFSMIGTGATIIQSIKISSNVLIGAGAVVTQDFNEPGIYFGVPARKKK